MAVPRKIQCTVDKIVDHGAHVYTLELHSPVNLPAVKPGQFLHLALDPYDPGSFWPESRIFSIAKVNRETNSLTLCYSVKGIFTSRMETELIVGKLVWIILPFGDFVVAPEEDTVLIAGGTGITPFVQFLESTHKKRCVLLYGARKESLLLFRNEIDHSNSMNPNFTAYVTVEEECDDARIYNGRLTTKWILDHIKELENPIIYLSGPPAMIKFFLRELSETGIPGDHLCTDEWE